MNNNIIYRLFQIEDLSQLSILYVDSWKRTYSNIISDEFLNTLNYKMAEEKWIKFLKEEKGSFIYVAVDKSSPSNNEKICGLSVCKFDDDVKNTGLLYSLHVDHSYKGRGIGKNLIKLSAKHFKDHFNLSSLLLWVVVGNDNAYNVYTKLGATILKYQIQKYCNKENNEVCLIWNNTYDLINR